MSLRNDSCVEDETVDSFGRFCREKLDLVLHLVHIVARVRRRVVFSGCIFIFGSFSRRRLLLALFFYRSGCSFLPVVGPLFSFAVSILHHVALDLDRASHRSGLQPLSSAFLSRDHPDFLLGRVYESCWLHASTRHHRCCCGCMTVSSFCLSACHALRDVHMAFLELPVGELFTRVQHAHSRAARGQLD